MRIWTSRFHNKGLRDRHDLVKVAIVVSPPRWPLGYELADGGLLAPWGRLFHIDDEQAFTVAYRQRLDKLGVPRIRRELQRISNEHGGRDLVLLCYENLAEPGQWCHRRVFADWWRDMTGEVIEELQEV